MSEFISTAEAYRIARERESVAASFAANLLHMAIFDARVAGMSVREAARALSVPKSTVSRHWREDHRCSEVVPAWGSEAAWREAHAAIWAHNPRELADAWVPYEWHDHDDVDARVVTRKTRGVTTLNRDSMNTAAPRGVALAEPVPTPRACAGGVCGYCDQCVARPAQSDQ